MPVVFLGDLPAAVMAKVAGGDPVEEIVCSQPRDRGYLFAVVRLKTGRAAAVWESHGWVAKSADELAASGRLNVHELNLLRYKVHVE